jgi:aquaporin Z
MIKEDMMTRQLLAEAFGTFWLVLGGCGSAVLAAAFPEVGIGFLGVSLAFGLTVLTMAYAVGGISGGHFNPAVSLGLALAGRFEMRNLLPYWLAQVAGAIAAAAVLYVIVAGKADFAGVGGFRRERVWRGIAGRVRVDLGPDDRGGDDSLLPDRHSRRHGKIAPAGFAPIANGLCLTLIHLISIPVTNTSVNPARSTGVALFADGPALAQLWLFWVAPLAGAAVGAGIWRVLFADD